MFGFKRKSKDKAKKSAHSPTTENETVDVAQAEAPGAAAQKRSHFRLDCHIPAVTKVMKKDETLQMTIGEPQTGLISNLSAGGVGLMSNNDLDNNEKILLSFKLDNDLIVLTAEVKFKSECLNPEFVYHYGIMFTGSSVKEQDIIYKYLFDKQMQSFL